MSLLQRIVKPLWLSAQATRKRVASVTKGTALHRLLRVPSKFLLRQIDYRNWTKDSIFYREDELYMCSHQPVKVLDLVIKRFQPITLLDVGCGTGKAIDYLVERGVDAWGVEGSQLAISKATYPSRILLADLNKPVTLKRIFDVVYCYEVVEHIHPDFLESLMATICAHGNIVVMSHAQPGQGGEGHFNEQPDDYWIDQFSRRHYALDTRATLEFKECGDAFSDNLLVFRRAKPKS